MMVDEAYLRIVKDRKKQIVGRKHKKIKTLNKSSEKKRK